MLFTIDLLAMKCDLITGISPISKRQVNDDVLFSSGGIRQKLHLVQSVMVAFSAVVFLIDVIH